MNDSDSIVRLPNEGFGSSVPWLVAQLRAHEINIDPRCSLQRALDRLATLRRMLNTGEPQRFNTVADGVEYFAEGDGADFLSKMLHWGHVAGLHVEDERWRHLVSGNPIPAVAALSSRERNLAWESVLASAMATFCKDVHFAEPDIVGEFEGRVFGVAAKVAYSSSKLWRNVSKGAHQAGEQSDAAVIFVNVVNILPRIEVFEASRRLLSDSDVRDLVRKWADRGCRQPEALSFAAKWQETSRNPIGVAFFMPFVVEVGEESRRQPLGCYYVYMPVVWREEASPDYEFAHAFLRVCNSILAYQAPGEREADKGQST